MEEMNRKEALLELFNIAIKEKGIGGVVLYTKHKSYPQPEMIVVPRDNFELKAKYIEEYYTEELRLSSCDDIEIVAVSITDNSGEVLNIND